MRNNVRLPGDETILVWECPECKEIEETYPEDATVPYCCESECKNYEGEMEFSHVEVGGSLGDIVVAARKVVKRWEKGDLAGAVRQLDKALGLLDKEGRGKV